MEPLSSIGEWMRQQRRLLDLTQADLAEQVGCALVTIKKIEQETRRPSREIAGLLADALAIAPADRDAFVRLARGELAAAEHTQRDAVPIHAMSVQSVQSAPEPLPDHQPRSWHFVARERELSQLGTHLAGTVNGSGRTVFISGGAGSGKTSLMAAFARRGQAQYSDLLVLSGNCDALAGMGDPYLPFRDVMALLTGDVETRLQSGLLDQEQARRLRRQLPRAVEILQQHGPDLIELFIGGPALVNRAMRQAPDRVTDWHELQGWLAARQAVAAGLAQSQIYSQYIEVLRQMALQRPLLIVLDDLHWTDLSSAGLLFHLGRRLLDSRILILGAYRPDEIAAATAIPLASEMAAGQWAGDAPPERLPREHPIMPIIQEFKRRYGDIEIDLDRQVERGGRTFVDALLDQEPNRLDEAFRTALVAQTEGHPLFTVEMLRDMQERGVLIREEDQTWVQSRAVDWETLPARVEAVIGRRLESLPAHLYSALKIASVEGESFTAEVVAQVLETDPRQMVGSMGTLLAHQYRLVYGQGTRRVANRLISRYRFGHILFQKYLYDHLDPAERSYLHEAVGHVLEQLHADEVEQVAVQLAYHFEAAGMAEQAFTYLRMAGERAVRLSAHEEAATHFRRALVLLQALPPSYTRDVQEFHLRSALGVAMVTTRGWPAPETEEAYTAIHHLVQRMPYDADLAPALSGFYYTYPAVYLVRGDLPRTRAMAEANLQLAQTHGEPLFFSAAYAMLGPCIYHMGELVKARAITEQADQNYESHRRQSHVLVLGPDLSVFCASYAAHICWQLGHTDAALAHVDRALTVAHQQAHPFSVVVASSYMAMLYQFLDDPLRAQRQAEAALALCTHYEFVYYAAWSSFILGWATTRQGEIAAGIAQMEQALAELRAMGTGLRSSYYLTLLAQAHGQAGEFAKGLTYADAAIAWCEAHEEHYYSAEAHRIRGELLLHAPDVSNARAAAAAEFRCALEIAQQQQAAPFVARAQASLDGLTNRVV